MLAFNYRDVYREDMAGTYGCAIVLYLRFIHFILSYRDVEDLLVNQGSTSY